MDVLVAGAGIAGLSAGLAMTKAGHRVVIAERTGELREIGAVLSIWPNAMAALDYLGLEEQVRAVGLEAPTASIRARTGAAIVRFHTDAMNRALGGLPVVVLRAGLQAVLLEACSRLGIEIRLGESVEAVRVQGAGVSVATGAGQHSFDAVIGADGINSRVRDAVTERGELRDCNRIAWRALIPAPGWVGPEAWLTVGVGLQLIASPAPDHHLYWAADTPGKDVPVAAGEPADMWGVLRRRFGSWHEPIPRLIELTPPDALIVNRLFDRRPPRGLHRGPLLLVGDAAHAMTPDLGQGACQAIEDAAVLLACARRRPGAAPAELFAEFERIRLPRVRRIVRDSYAIGRVAVTPSPVGAGARDALTRLLPESLTNRRLAVYASARAFRRQLGAVTVSGDTTGGMTDGCGRDHRSGAGHGP